MSWIATGPVSLEDQYRVLRDFHGSIVNHAIHEAMRELFDHKPEPIPDGPLDDEFVRRHEAHHREHMEMAARVGGMQDVQRILSMQLDLLLDLIEAEPHAAEEPGQAVTSVL